MWLIIDVWWYGDLPLTLLGLGGNILEDIAQHCVCWCSGTWYHQVIDKYDIVYVEWGCLPQNWYLTTFIFWGIEIKYISFSLRRVLYTKGSLHHIKWYIPGLILGLHTASKRWHYFVTMALIGWVQTWNQPFILSQLETLSPEKCFNSLLYCFRDRKSNFINTISYELIW